MSSYRPRFHLSPPQGRLNDPNGVYLDGTTLHVYYQHDPCFPETPKRTGWGHAVTALTGPGALDWRHLPAALEPDCDYDRDGCYSGSAVLPDGDPSRLRLYYTGNRKDGRDGGDGGDGGERRTTQNLVTVDDRCAPDGGRHRRSAANPLIDGPAPGYTSHFRDPQITADSADSADTAAWRMVLGAQRVDGTGAVVVYRSPDLDTWRFSGEITFDTSAAVPGDAPDIVPAGYMWECPNLVTLADEVTGEQLDVLVICPQGLEPRTVDGVTHYRNVDTCGYLVGTLDGAGEGTTFHVRRGFSELDLGHEFYAPQVAAASAISAAADRPLLLGWMGLPGKDDQPTVEAEGWVHCLTVPRRLSLRNHRLHQELVLPESPTDEGFVVHREDLGDAPVELAVAAASATDGTGRREVVSLDWQPGSTAGTGRLTVTRDDDARVVACPPGGLVVLVDHSAVEITAGDGAVALSLRAFYAGEPDITSNSSHAYAHLH